MENTDQERTEQALGKTRQVSITSALLNDAEMFVGNVSEQPDLLDYAQQAVDYESSAADDLSAAQAGRKYISRPGTVEVPCTLQEEDDRSGSVSTSSRAKVHPAAVAVSPILTKPCTGELDKMVAATKAQRMMRGFVTRKWVARLYLFQSAMRRSWFVLFMAYLILIKMVVFATFILATLDVFTTTHYNLGIADQSDDVCPLPTHTTPQNLPIYRTWFHEHPQTFGWAYDALVSFHLVTAILLVWVLPANLFTKKGGWAHVLAGRIFLCLWACHFANGMANASRRVIASGWHEANYPATNGFPMWLYIQFSFVGTVLPDFIIQGVAVIQFKLDCPLLYRILFVTAPVTTMALGAVLFGAGILCIANPSSSLMLEYGIVFVVQTPAYGYLLAKNISHWTQKELGQRMHTWIVEHQRNMLFAANLTLMVGLANMASKVAPNYSGITWALQDVSLFFWIGFRSRKMQHKLATAQAKVPPNVGTMAHRYRTGHFTHTTTTTVVDASYRRAPPRGGGGGGGSGGQLRQRRVASNTAAVAPAVTAAGGGGASVPAWAVPLGTPAGEEGGAMV